MIRSRRFALATAAVIFALTSCGDPNTAQPAAQKPKVIELANGGGAETRSAAPTAADAAESKMAAFGPVDYVYDGDLPALDQPAPSWFFAAKQQPDQERIAKLAKSLGIEGDVRAVPAEQGGGWAVGSSDFSGPVLTVGTDGMLSWWYSPGPIASTSYACAEPGIAIDPNNGDGAGLPVQPVDVSAPGVVDVAVEPPSGGGVGGDPGTPTDSGAPTDVAPPAADVIAPDSPECVPPAPPTGIPTKDEALAKARELMASWGYDIAAYDFDNTYADEWNATVSASLVLEGMKAPVTVSVGFGENGSITWASGSLAEPQRGADYPTVGAAEGLKRLKDQPAMYGDPRIMSSGGVAGDVAIAPAVGAPEISPCEPGPATDCAPISTEPVTVTLNSVKLDLTMVWDADNTVWLLPAYTFGSADGGTYTVMAVDDSFIKQPTPDVPVGEPTPLPSPAPDEAPPTEDPAAVPTT